MQPTQASIINEQSPTFVKGMTLGEYLSKAEYREEEGERETGQEQAQNLFESSKQGGQKYVMPQGNDYRIDQIDQESMQDSIDYKRSRQRTPKVTPKLNTRETLELNNPSTFQNANSLTLRKGLFKSSSKEKSQFRIKQLSVSPMKKRQQESPLGGSITLYGHKFRQTILGKSSMQTPELLTFYGKLGDCREEGRGVGGRKNARGKVPQSKGNFKKKNRLQLHELQVCQSRIRQNYGKVGGVVGVGRRGEGVRPDRCSKYC